MADLLNVDELLARTVGAAAGTVVGFHIDELSNRLSVIMMLLFSSVALSQIAVTSHKPVPYSTVVERYMTCGCVSGCHPLMSDFFVHVGTRFQRSQPSVHAGSSC
jgi:hypothetical protein